MDKTFIMSAVIFDPGAAPSLEEYLQAIAGKPTDGQESLQILAPRIPTELLPLRIHLHERRKMNFYQDYY